jgi:hypothetical protein
MLAVGAKLMEQGGGSRWAQADDKESPVGVRRKIMDPAESERGKLDGFS